MSWGSWEMLLASAFLPDSYTKPQNLGLTITRYMQRGLSLYKHQGSWQPRHKPLVADGRREHQGQTDGKKNSGGYLGLHFDAKFIYMQVFDYGWYAYVGSLGIH